MKPAVMMERCTAASLACSRVVLERHYCAGATTTAAHYLAFRLEMVGEKNKFSMVKSIISGK